MMYLAPLTVAPGAGHEGKSSVLSGALTRADVLS